ncbi:hypothetical protein [Methanococcus maripaludis]|uniref:dTDP-4-amino-4,6-dideoxygalactose transaminase n=1 Tax=Methanococcus maripaludis TaxID=39152 RepID=A0A7J9PG55_METMI|nr:hypothetical protein [Methanococcus maripaludis]MBA2860459.1 hypothetical protein [Methanococcus maripaludis]
MKEIGGYFGLDQLIKNEYHKNLIALNTGRNSLLYILRAKNIKKLYIPYYLCDSISHMLSKEEYDFEYYAINDSFYPNFDKKLNDFEYIYIVNYYGQLTNRSIRKLKEKYGQIIIDNVQSFFQRPVNGVDTIYSCRKFFGVPDGAYLSTDAKLDYELKTDISKDRMKHILGRFEENASEYYAYFQENDKNFKKTPLMKMSNLTKNIMGAIDYNYVKKVRNENYFYIADKLGSLNILNISKPDGPFAYPFYIANGIEIRKKLAEKKIYVPILWPNVLKDCKKDTLEYDYAANILPLPCDQRYSINDMNRLIDTILED